MGGTDGVMGSSLTSRWVLEGGVVVASPDFERTQAGASLDVVRRIPFGAHKLNLDKLSLDDHWTLDLGLGLQSLGWAGGRPATLSVTARSGVSYNILNVVDVGFNLRGGYANVSNGDGSQGGPWWSAGFRMMTSVNPVSVFTEGGFFSQPAVPGGSRETGVYGIVGAGYLFP